MKLVVIYGPPGVGKLTVASALAAATEFKLLHNHMIADLIVPVFGLRTPASIELSAEIRNLICETAARNNIAGVVSTFVYYPGEQAHRVFADYKKIMAKYGGELFVIGLTASSDVLKHRVSDSSRQGTRKITSPEKLAHVIADENLMAVVPQEVVKNLVIDTTTLQPEAVVLKIKDYCSIQAPQTP